MKKYSLDLAFHDRVFYKSIRLYDTLSPTSNYPFLLQVDLILIGQSNLDQPIRMLEEQLSLPRTSWRSCRRQCVMESYIFVEDSIMECLKPACKKKFTVLKKWASICASLLCVIIFELPNPDDTRRPFPLIRACTVVEFAP